MNASTFPPERGVADPGRRRRRWSVWAVMVTLPVALCGLVVGDGGDVGLYGHWIGQGLHHGAWPVLDGTWVYPVGALAPMLVAVCLGGGVSGVAIGWVLLVVGLNTAVVVRLAKANPVAAWWWLGFTVLLGEVGLLRLDTVPTALVTLALLMVVSRPALASTIVTAAAWMKVWPVVVLGPAALAVGLRRLGRITVPLLGVTGALAGFAAEVGHRPSLLGFASMQTDRGLQVEAVAATPFVWLRECGLGVQVTWNDSLKAWNLSGPGVAGAARLCDVALPALTGLAALLLLRAWARRADTVDLLTVGAFLLPLVLIAADKVGSPQYLTWVAPAVAVAIAYGRRGWAVPGIGVLVAAALTQILYPWTYWSFLHGGLLPLLVLTARNGLLIFLTGWGVRAAWRLGHPEPAETTP